MADDSENLTLRLLREIREDVRGLHGRMESLEDRMDALETKVDGNAVLLNMLFGVLSEHDKRIEVLENHTASK